MMHGEEHSPAGESAPLHFICPTCGADSDDEDKVLELGNPAFVPRADYGLLAVRCRGCGTVTDFAIWLINREQFLQEQRHSGELSDTISPDAMEILDRYHRLVKVYCDQWNTSNRGEPDLCEIDMSALTIHMPTPTRTTSIPAGVLAAARGLRKAAVTHPGLTPAGMLRVGHFACLLSLDGAHSEGRPYVLHLSAANGLTPGRLSTAEERFVLSLFFTPDELPLVWCEQGKLQPIIHYYLKAASPDIKEVSA
jgi:hypothetical protein